MATKVLVETKPQVATKSQAAANFQVAANFLTAGISAALFPAVLQSESIVVQQFHNVGTPQLNDYFTYNL